VKHVTVYGDKKNVNINTADPKVLEALLNACVAKLKDSGTDIKVNPARLSEIILEYRDIHPFVSINLEGALDLSGPDESEFKAIINGLKGVIDVQSQNFRIIAESKIRKTDTTRKTECVFNRESKKIVYWRLD
jgi:type II secretory pathway component PulK